MNGRVVHLQGRQPHHGIPRRNRHLAQPLRLNLQTCAPPQMGRACDVEFQELHASLCTSLESSVCHAHPSADLAEARWDCFPDCSTAVSAPAAYTLVRQRAASKASQRRVRACVRVYVGVRAGGWGVEG